MLYIITGVPRSGKSIFSQILSKAKGISKIDFDDITTLFEEFIPEYGLFMTMDQEIREIKSLPIMKSLINKYMATNQSLIIEGDNVSLKDYKVYNELTRGNLKILVFGYENLTSDEKIKINTDTTNKKNLTCWFENLEYKEKIRIANEFINRSKKLKKQVQNLNIPNQVRYFNTHNSFEEEMNKALDFCNQ